MEDRELLELAAKAAGLRVKLWEGHSGTMCAIDDDHHGRMWMPLHDDGDALRLAVKLGLAIHIDTESAGVITVEWDFTAGGFPRHCLEQDAPEGGDDDAATRRAIVLAAAEIGRGMA